jgi:hypothetical protein
MILSYNVIKKDKDSSKNSIKEEGINEIENIKNTNKKSIIKKNKKIKIIYLKKIHKTTQKMNGQKKK